MTNVKAKNFEGLVGKLEGLSEKQILQHLDLYKGYVKKLNEIRDRIAKIPYDKRQELTNFSYGEYSELKRREPVAYNGVYLHELYFENLGKTGGKSEASGDLRRAIEGSFGSASNWELDLFACGNTATNGWVILTYDPNDRMLHHNQVWEHSDKVMIGQLPVLALDAWEHAFMIDFGTDKLSYMKTFLENLNWKTVNERFESARAEAAAIA
ncbi:MAG: superoxide dismutase [Thermoanaerobaculia bacterium]